MTAAEPVSSPLYATYARADLAFERGEGVWLETASGERYLDLMGGIAVNAFGHANPHLVKALKEQAEKLWHVSNIFKIPGQEELGRRLCEASFAERVFFTNSGGEAMECAIKTARRYHFAKGAPERHRIVTFEGAFHGRTLATIAAGGQKKYLEGFGPVVPGFDQVPLGDRDALKAAIGPETAAILIEPIQGEGGIRPVPYDFMRFIRDLCDEHGILMVLDEIQCGMGRTGRLFAHEWAGIRPDVMAIAKAIGGGFPLGACLATAEASDAMIVGTHGSTYGGNPLAMAVGNAVLDLVLDEEFLPEVRRKGLLFKQKLAGLADGHPELIEGVRGEGMMLGLKVKGAPADIVAHFRDHGVLTVGAGDNVVRLLPALVISEAEMDEGIARMEAALASASAAAA
ncbi:aspartate aminotransferase family protein [Afifella sp. IM 167]|uniref:aspartate aminotransferase family protein n=1 Tax=Afifella sp. IM 167 TaxID=2033586 RepID=UPI001CCCECDE|nr:aspartate aminotransferase family protein [Afifella sp. IM 167]MBZ8133855.1 acetylornithine transaminase [Afifella sp. IM 167]